MYGYKLPYVLIVFTLVALFLFELHNEYTWLTNSKNLKSDTLGAKRPAWGPTPIPKEHYGWYELEIQRSSKLSEDLSSDLHKLFFYKPCLRTNNIETFILYVSLIQTFNFLKQIIIRIAIELCTKYDTLLTSLGEIFVFRCPQSKYWLWQLYLFEWWFEKNTAILKFSCVRCNIQKV